MPQVLAAAFLLGASSLLGSLLGFIVRKIPHKLNDIFLGFCAGMMLAAAIVCLAMPAIEAVGDGGMWQVALGIIIGALVISMLDKITPHLHNLTGLDPEQHEHNATINRVMLFVIAIAIHKLPEGMSTGVAFNAANTANADALSLTIALQNVPEGLVIVTPLLVAGIKKRRAMVVALVVASLEMLGVFLGFWLGSLSEALLPPMMGMAAGSMIYVIGDEMIPETHSHGYQKAATFAMIFGFVAMLFIE